jgi:hypothetical protein
LNLLHRVHTFKIKKHMKTYLNQFLAVAALCCLLACSDENESESRLNIENLFTETPDDEGGTPAYDMVITVDQILQIQEFYYFIDTKGYYHPFKYGNPICTDSASLIDALYVKVADLAAYDGILFGDKDVLLFHQGELDYLPEGAKKGGSPGPAPGCPPGSFETGGTATERKKMDCITKGGKDGYQYCDVNTRGCRRHTTGAMTERFDVEGAPGNCTKCKKKKKNDDDGWTDYAEVVTPYCGM